MSGRAIYSKLHYYLTKLNNASADNILTHGQIESLHNVEIKIGLIDGIVVKYRYRYKYTFQLVYIIPKSFISSSEICLANTIVYFHLLWGAKYASFIVISVNNSHAMINYIRK